MRAARSCPRRLRRTNAIELVAWPSSKKSKGNSTPNYSARFPPGERQVQRANAGPAINCWRNASHQKFAPGPQPGDHRGWRTPLPSRKSTNPPANSCCREVTLPTRCLRNWSWPIKYVPLSREERSALTAPLILPSRVKRAACPSEIAVIEPPRYRKTTLDDC